MADQRIETEPPVTLPEGNHLVSEIPERVLPVRRPGKRRERNSVVVPNGVFAVYHTTEEKGSDVNLATHLLNDAWNDLFDLATVISTDTDLVTPIRMVKEERNKLYPIFLDLVLVRCFRASSAPGVSGVANGTIDVHHGAYRMRFPMIRARRAPRIRARSAEGIMTGKNQVFRHPEAAAFLRSLAAAEAAKHPPLVREHDGVITQYWRDGGEVRCREVEAGEEPEMEALLAAVESEFGRSLPRLRAELRGDGVPDLDALETSIREKMLKCGAKACKALLEAYGAELPAPPCATCGERMDQSARAVKGFLSRLGLIDLERIYFHCRDCRVGLHPLDRALDLVGRNATPGAESICADAASSDSYEAASRKLKNLAGVDVPKSTLQRCCMRIGQEVQAFEREDVEPEAPSADRVLAGSTAPAFRWSRARSRAWPASGRTARRRPARRKSSSATGRTAGIR